MIWLRLAGIPVIIAIAYSLLIPLCNLGKWMGEKFGDTIEHGPARRMLAEMIVMAILILLELVFIIFPALAGIIFLIPGN